MKSKILVLGKGFIGKRLQEALNCDISGRKIYSFKNAEEEIKRHNPKIIINCIGYSGGKNSVDGCELDRDKTILADTFVPIILAEICLRKKIKLIHISSGCIYKFDYSKDKPIKEQDLPDFLDLFYSRSKIYAERVLEILSPKANILILRIRLPLDNQPHPRNLLTKLINYKRVIELPNSISYLPDCIKALRHLIKIDARGIYNLVNKGGLKYSALLDIYKRYVPDFRYKIVDYKKLNLTRPNLILSTKKLEKSGFKIRHIKETLEECVQGYLSH